MDDTALVGRRVRVGDDRGTVRWVGTIPDRKGKPVRWLGVEWDDPTRGRHDGTHQRIRYFACRNSDAGPTSASFVAPRKADLGVTLHEALLETYESVSSGPIMVSMRKQAEFVGETAAASRMARIESLPRFALGGSRVARAGDPVQLAAVSGALRELDVSDALLSDWADIVAIARGAPRLEMLNIMGNRLDHAPLDTDEDPLDAASAFAQLRVAVLSRTAVSWPEACRFATTWAPAVTELHVASCGLTSLAATPALDAVTILDLQGNGLTWTEVWRLAAMPALRTLRVGENAVEAIDVPSDGDGFAALQSLSLPDNDIADWDSVQALGRLPALDDLRLSGNPVVGGRPVRRGGRSGSAPDSPSSTKIVASPGRARLEVIARLCRLQRFNGGAVGARERTDAERLYLQQCAGELVMAAAVVVVAEREATAPLPEPDAAFLGRHPRYPELLALHGAPTVATTRTDAGHGTLQDELAEISVLCHAPEASNHEPFVRRFPLSMTVGKLRMLSARIFGLDPGRARLHYQGTEAAPFPEPMDDDRRALSFYAVVDGGTVLAEVDNARE